ncbi:MAG: O-methyltransferase [Planctomycetota bacterium]|jgi:predicted O-methyltransferase YrrM
MLMATLKQSAKNLLRPQRRVVEIGEFKRSGAPWAADAVFADWRANRYPVTPGCEAKIDAIADETRRTLTGQRRTTTFRHEMVEMDAGEVAGGVSSPREGGLLLNALVRVCRPRRAYELGSAFGVGTMYMAAALNEIGAGRVDGIEFEGWRARLAGAAVQEHWPGFGAVHPGAIEQVLPRLAQTDGRGDFAFVDAVHRYEETMGYHHLLRDALNPGATAVFDDIDFSEQMLAFWDDLVDDPRISDAVLIRGRWGVVRYAEPVD